MAAEADAADQLREVMGDTAQVVTEGAGLSRPVAKNLEQLGRIFGKKVTVHGKVEARILPFPSVTMNDVRVGQDVDGSPIVQIERFSMDAELAPFLSGEARIFDMRIEKPKARVRVLPDGRLDWMRGGAPVVPAKTVVVLRGEVFCHLPQVVASPASPTEPSGDDSEPAGDEATVLPLDDPPQPDEPADAPSAPAVKAT